MKLGIYIGSNVYNMHAQHLGRYLEGQGHSMTLQQKRVGPLLYLKLDYLTEMITILR